METVGGLILVGFVIGGIFLFIVLVLAPLKLYEIARELRTANEHLKYSNELHKYLADSVRFYSERLDASAKTPPGLP
jgi:biopolymer transport protein ExbB/TolQ